MFSEEAMKQFSEWAREKADAVVKNSFHPLERDSIQAKQLWEKVYISEMQARTCRR